MEAQSIYDDGELLLVGLDDIFVSVWTGETSVKRARLLSERFRLYVQSRPSIVGVLTIVDADAPLPSSEARQVLADVLSESVDRIGAAALVFEGAGFKAAAVRSVVTGIMRIAKPPFPNEVHRSVHASLSWMLDFLNPRLVPPLDARTLARKLEPLRARRGTEQSRVSDARASAPD